MNKIIVVMLVLLAGATGASAQLPPQGFIGLFIDAQHTEWCTQGVPLYPVEMWIWCLPGEHGQICAEFAVSYPSNVIQSTVTSNGAMISVTLGDLATGMSVCYVACQYAWNWPFHQTLYVTDARETDVRIVPHLGVGVYQFASCLPGYPTEQCYVYSSLNINHCELVPARAASWGAVKTQLDE